MRTVESASVLTHPSKRSDAVRNRALVIAAAESAFAGSGIDVPIDEIARRAGVGKATVYRSFPTKGHLIAGVAIERLDRFERMVREALAEEDAGAAFRAVLIAMATSGADDRVLIDAMRLASPIPELEAARARLGEALERLMRRAKRQGRLRRDADPADVRVLLSGLKHALTEEQQRDRAVWERYANLVADALGAGGERAGAAR
jgi:AcrR family transcriptional regulator